MLLGLAGAFVLVGLIDTGSARGLGPRLFGAFLVVVGLLTAAEFLGHHRPAWLRWSALGAGLLVLGTGVIAFVITMSDLWRYGYLDVRRLTFAAGAILIGGWMAWSAREHVPKTLPAWLDPIGNPDKTRLDNLKTSIEMLGLIGIGAAAIAFSYTNLYVPSIAQPTVNVEVALDVPEGSLTTAHASVTLRNESEFRVRVLGSEFEIIVQPVGSYESALAACVLVASANGAILNSGSPWASVLNRGDAVVVGDSELVAAGTWLEPDEVLSLGFAVPIPDVPTQQRIIRARAAVHLTKADVVGLNSEWISPDDPPLEWPTEAIGGDVTKECTQAETRTHVGSTRWTIDEESVFNMLTRDPVTIDVEWWMGNGIARAYPVPLHNGNPIEGTGADADQSSIADAYARMSRLYGLVMTEAVDEVAVER